MALEGERTSYVRATFPRIGNVAALVKILQRLAAQCLSEGLQAALALLPHDWSISREELAAVIGSLPHAGFGAGFKLAFVPSSRDVFEDLVSVEQHGLRHGIHIRVFFHRDNAVDWLTSHPLA